MGLCYLDVVLLAELDDDGLKSDGVRLASVCEDSEPIAELPSGHAEIVAKVVEWLRAAYTEARDPRALPGNRSR